MNGESTNRFSEARMKKLAPRDMKAYAFEASGRLPATRLEKEIDDPDRQDLARG
jgi:hypothetical protein